MITNDTRTYVIKDKYYESGDVIFGIPIEYLPPAERGTRPDDTVILVTGSPVVRIHDNSISGKNIRRVSKSDLALIANKSYEPEVPYFPSYKTKQHRRTPTHPMKSRNKGFRVSTYRETASMEYEDRNIAEEYGVQVGGVRKKKHPYSYYDDYTYDLRSRKDITWKNKKVNRQWNRHSNESKLERIDNKWKHFNDYIFQ